MKEFSITFDQFEKHINHAISIMHLQDSLYGVISDYNANNRDELDFGYWPTLLDDVVDLLELLTDDTENHWISYWFFDLDCGRTYKDGCVVDGNGNNIKMESLHDLWNVLKNN